jgi:spermidine/putrescine transport system permease protein
MSSLFRSYGVVLSSIFVGLTTIWIVGMIVLPLATMVERAFIWVERGDAAKQMELKIDRVYQRLGTIKYDIKALEKEIEQGKTGGGVATPSPSNPFAPAAKIGKDVTNGLPSPFARNKQDPAKRLEKLKTEQAKLKADVVHMEEEEKRLKAAKVRDTGYSLKNFTSMSKLHLRIFFLTLFYAFLVTLISFLVCYPVAYVAATTRSNLWAALLLLGLIIPYSMNELMRIFAWNMILEKNGVFNLLLDNLGLIDLAKGEGNRWVASNGAVFAVLIYTYLLLMVFPIYNTIQTLDKSQIEAARDMGASSLRIHRRIVIPHAKPGIAVGSIMTFMLAAGSFSVPTIVGRGMHPDWFSQVIARKFFEAGNWNIGAAFSLALLVACILFIVLNLAIFRVRLREAMK